MSETRPPEFRRRAVELYRSSGRSLKTIAEELVVGVESLRPWNKQFETHVGERERLSSDEGEELRVAAHRCLSRRYELSLAATPAPGTVGLSCPRSSRTASAYLA